MFLQTVPPPTANNLNEMNIFKPPSQDRSWVHGRRWRGSITYNTYKSRVAAMAPDGVSVSGGQTKANFQLFLIELSVVPYRNAFITSGVITFPIMSSLSLITSFCPFCVFNFYGCDIFLYCVSFSYFSILIHLNYFWT